MLRNLIDGVYFDWRSVLYENWFQRLNFLQYCNQEHFDYFLTMITNWTDGLENLTTGW